LVFDTIDFLDIVGIVALHDAARRRNIPVISALSAGWGAAAIYFSATCETSFREIFGLPAEGDVSSASYVALFADVVERIGRNLEPDVAASLAKTLTVMSDGSPCPASQVSAGAASVAAIATAMTVRILCGKPVAEAPRMVMLNMGELLIRGGVDLV
jgi:molybdopterin-synthase adenylyltransferase